MKPKSWRLPEAFDFLLTYGGGLLILSEVIWTDASTPRATRIAMVGFGLVCNQIGIWHVAGRLSRKRRYLGLRLEVDHFMSLVRSLNEHVVARNAERMERVRTQMYASIERMVLLAGQEGPPNVADASSGARPRSISNSKTDDEPSS